MLSTKTSQTRTENYAVIASEAATASTASQAAAEPPVSSVVKTRKRADKGIVISEEERVHVARLIRVLRTNYWLSSFFKSVLWEDSKNPNLLPIKEVQEHLDNQKKIESLVDSVQTCCGNKRNYYHDHPLLKAIADEWTDVFEYQGDQRIRNLIESAKQAQKK